MCSSTPTSTTSGEPQDQLLLALAHGPLSPQLLSALVERTAQQSCEITKSMRDNCTNNHRKTPTQRLVLTGSSRVTRPGRQLEEWETLWTAGEHVMNQVVERVGLEKFHLVGTDVKLLGHLMDISQQNNVMMDEKENDGHCDNEDNDDDAWRSNLKDDLTMIATRVESHLRVKQVAPVSKATVIVPIDAAKAKASMADRANLVTQIETVLRETWSKTESPLKEVELAIELVF